MRGTYLLVGVVCALAARPAWGERRKADVVVYGSTPAGIIAAVSVAREGKTALILEPGKHLGGMATGGLGATDTGNRSAIGGYSREFYRRVRDHYVKKYGADSPQVKDCSDGFRFEPHVATLVFRDMLQEAKVEVLFGQRVHRVVKNGARIVSLRTETGDEFQADVYIDASYEGDLMARAGVRYVVGREGRDQYGEPLAGMQERSPFHQWPVKVSPFAADGMLLPLVQPPPNTKAGAGDHKVQAYNFRLCMTQDPKNMVPWPKPANYDPQRYELLARYLKARPEVTLRQLMNPVMMPNGKTDTNNNGPISTDHIGANWDYPDADYATRARIWQDHVDYQQGFFWFLAHDPRVPPTLQAEIRSWGLAKDEFTDTGHWPPQLYVREARRMVGAYVVTQKDVVEERTKADSVGLGSYNMDSHHVQRFPLPDGSVLNEGDFQVRCDPYAVPYRALTPKPGECDNLLVPVCLSASHVAYGTIRMEPVFMILGQAAGNAAVLAIDENQPVQRITVDKLTAKLKSQQAVLSPAELPRKAGVAAPIKRIDAAKLEGVVVDDEHAARTGNWLPSQSVGPIVGTAYVHDNNEDKGKKRIRFAAKNLPAGRYEVRLYFSPHPNRATNVPVVVYAAGKETTVIVNQRQPRKEADYHRLGLCELPVASEAWVEVRTEGTNGYVVADAVQFVPIKP